MLAVEDYCKSVSGKIWHLSLPENRSIGFLSGKVKKMPGQLQVTEAGFHVTPNLSPAFKLKIKNSWSLKRIYL